MQKLRRLRGEQGLTLIEMLLAFIILALLITIALPAFLGDTKDKTHDAKARTYLGVSGRIASAVWTPMQGYPPLGNRVTEGSMIYELSTNEPELEYGNVVGDKPETIQVYQVDDYRITFASKSESNLVYCLEVIEIEIDGWPAGEYWAAGPAEAADPCGEDAIWSRSPSGQPLENGIPDSPGGEGDESGDDPDPPFEPGPLDPDSDPDAVPDPPVILDENEDVTPFEFASVISDGNLIMSSNSKITGDVATNGYVQLNGNATICGDVKVGEGQTVYTSGNGNITCDGQIAEGDTYLPAPGIAPTETDNHTIPATFGGPGKGNQGTYNATTRVLNLKSNNDLTLPGNTYVLCSISMSSNSDLKLSNPGDVRIYLDAPENCPTNPTTQLDMNSNTELDPKPEIKPAPGSPPRSVAIIFLGSNTSTTHIQLDSNARLDPDCSDTFRIYAPRSTMQMDANSTFCGAVASKKITMASNAEIRLTSDASDWVLPTE